MRAPIADDAITVTTATRSEAEVRADLGVEAPTVDPPAAAGAAGADDPATAAEADSDKPDAALSEAGRTLRLSRGDARKAKIQTEINELVSTREKTREEIARLQELRDKLAKPTDPPAERKPAADAATPNADGNDSAAPTFAFPTYEQWQVDHPDDGWEAYSDARTDARYAFNRQAERAVEDKAQEERAITDAFARADQHQKTFKADHPDYETKLQSLDLRKYGVEVVDGVIVKAPQQFIGLQRLLLRAGEAGPGILYYLADHPEDVARLLDRSTGPGDLLELWGEVKYAAKASTPATSTPAAVAAAAAPAAPAAEPARPRTSAPAPLAAVAGSATVTKTPQQLSEDAGEDADAYIAVREPRLLKRR